MVTVRVLVGDLVDRDELATVAGPALGVDHGGGHGGFDLIEVVHGLSAHR